MLEPARRRDGDVTARELPELCIPLGPATFKVPVVQ